ncbi:MAG: beta-ketoacyl-ACP synthase II [Ruminococcus sp.]|jgi:3-oxoacyl-[acyl-carrier-protein] synthase II|nr:beta-ketoacyl-ACP synthase II [Ruminococcus sp.]
MSSKGVAITGIGVITPIAQGVKDFDSALRRGDIGFNLLGDRFGADFPIKIAAEVKDFDASKYFPDKKDIKRNERFAQFAVAAALDALEDCGSEFEDIDRFRKGILYGVGIGGLQLTLDEHSKMLEKGSNRISALYIPMMIANMSSGAAALRLKSFCGDNFVCTSACASSTHALGEAFRKVKDGYLDVCIAGGAESVVNELAIAAFNNMKALTKSSDINRASIPFDKERDGFVLGEGAAALVLENTEHARARGARIYAEIVGYGATDDAYHITAPSPDGEAAAYAMTAAVKEAGLAPSDIDYINAHGTSTPMNDRCETAAIKKAFGEHSAKLKVNSTKSLFGHMLGAAGAAEAAAAALEIYGHYLHKTAGLTVDDPECDLNNCKEGFDNIEIRAALSNSLGFGGHNACIALREVK